MSKKYLITLDVNGTLLDTNYRKTSPTINSIIQQLTGEGHIIILNSNRSLEDLISIARMFEITGPLIAENGCCIYDQNNTQTKVLLDEETKKHVNELKAKIQNLILTEFEDSIFLVGDTTDINRHLDIQEIPQDKKYLFIMNEFRKYTISIHAKKIVDDHLIKDIDKVRNFKYKVKEIIEQSNYNLKAEYIEEFANLLVLPKTINKVIAYKELIKDYSSYKKIIITDDEMDNPSKDEFDYLFVVGNASESAKQMADYVSNEIITKGVEEILLKIDELTK